MRYLYELTLIVTVSSFCIVGQERTTGRRELTVIQRQTIDHAKKMRTEISYNDMTSTQKIFYLQKWLYEDIYEDVIPHLNSQIMHEIPEISFEEIKDELKQISRLSDTLCNELRETSDRIWIIDLLNVINLQLLPVTNSVDMFNVLRKLKSRKN
jgi:hypothetical protein